MRNMSTSFQPEYKKENFASRNYKFWYCQAYKTIMGFGNKVLFSLNVINVKPFMIKIFNYFKTLHA